MELKRNFTGINERVRRALDISRDEYAYCAYVLYRQADTRQKLRGWCCDTKEQLAYFVGISRPGLYKMTDRMIAAGLLEVDAPTGFLCVTPYFMDIENDCKQGLQSEFEQDKQTVNKVYTDCKQSLHESENSVNLVTHNIGIEGVYKKEEERKPHQAKPDTVTPSFPQLNTEEQMRVVWLYSKRQLEEIPSMKITQAEKEEKTKKHRHVLAALKSEEFRELITQYKAYRKSNKGIKSAKKWYDSEVTLCACIAELALHAGLNANGEIDMANVRRVYEQTTEKGYIGFFELNNQTPFASKPSEATQTSKPRGNLNLVADFS
jgi:hypothetical protein